MTGLIFRDPPNAASGAVETRTRMTIASLGARGSCESKRSEVRGQGSAVRGQQSKIENRKSKIENRQSAIGNRQSAIGNRQSSISNPPPPQKSLPAGPLSDWKMDHRVGGFGERKAHSEADGRPRRRRASGESAASLAAAFADSRLARISASMAAR
jgi:hypothetical protein